MRRTNDRKPTTGISREVSWSFRVASVQPATGKQVVRTTCTQATATDGASGSPLAELLDEWIDHGETRGRSRNTIHGYRSKAKPIKAGPLGAMPAPPSNEYCMGCEVHPGRSSGNRLLLPARGLEVSAYLPRNANEPPAAARPLGSLAGSARSFVNRLRRPLCARGVSHVCRLLATSRVIFTTLAKLLRLLGPGGEYGERRKASSPSSEDPPPRSGPGTLVRDRRIRTSRLVQSPAQGFALVVGLPTSSTFGGGCFYRSVEFEYVHPAAATIGAFGTVRPEVVARLMEPDPSASELPTL
jgi:hypothetical protein